MTGRGIKTNMKRRQKTAHDYGNEIMTAVDLALDKRSKSNIEWNKKYGNKCLYDVTVSIVKNAMRSRGT